MQILRESVAVVDDADRDVGSSVGQVHGMVDRQYFHLDPGVKAPELDKIRHEQMCREERGQCHPQKPAYTLVATKYACF